MEMSKKPTPIRTEHDRANLQEIETDLLCAAIYRYYGFDFRHYARSSMLRRINDLLEIEKLPTISALQERVLHDKQMMERFILHLSINVTAMFRDVGMYRAVRQKVVPILQTYPAARVWHAGCSSGEEAFSMRIVLDEEGFGDRTKIYATDFNEAIIKKLSWAYSHWVKCKNTRRIIRKQVA
jgi:chemotaxis protein methyltransferase CheR